MDISEVKVYMWISHVCGLFVEHALHARLMLTSRTAVFVSDSVVDGW